MILIIDNYDSFTFNLVDYFQQLGIAVKVFKNDSSLNELSLQKFSGLVLSPGPETPKTAGNLMPITNHFLARVPMLGICLGHQALGLTLGATLVKAKKPMHGKISKIRTKGGMVYNGLPKEFNVVRYHSLILEDVPKSLMITGETENGEVMSIEDVDQKVTGIQFHPEAVLTEYGLNILKNWVSFYNIV